ncbi:methyl-accepting chemotaxis protein [Azorhizobium sp. AG788]|uniref:methyl-accepting chemotaxis protein n=1 Tax=Azorhizobium sp. AG788 TaxID=2183897 RepID=UPI0031386562
MRISLKQSLTAVIVLLLVCLVSEGWLAHAQLKAVNSRMEEITEDWLPSIQQLGQIEYRITRYRLSAVRSTLSSVPDPQIRDKLVTQLAAAQASFRSYEALSGSDTERDVWRQFLAIWETYATVQDKFLSLAADGKRDEAAAAVTASSAVFDKVIAALEKGIAYNSTGAEAASRDVHQAGERGTWSILVATGIALAIGLCAIVFVLLRVSRPLDRITAAMMDVAKGEFATPIPSLTARNEIGDIARTLEVFRDGLLDTERRRIAQEQKDRDMADTLAQERNAIADSFQARMGSLSDRFATSSDEVAAAARNLSATAEQTSRQAETVTAAAEGASGNVQTVAASAEELSASIQEMSQQITASADIARNASEEAERTTVSIHSLSTAANGIGDVVNLIKDIAAQTNLLALNATIEAARAGEAGRGFAVVAQEVKQLAAQTARATDEISAKIGEIQGATAITVGTIENIVRTITTIRDVSGGIAAAVEQQRAATAEIAENTQRAANGASDVTTNIGSVGQAAGLTGAAATQLMSLSGDLSAHSSDLQNEVVSFVASLRTA